jgi:hypothetical protein
MDYVSIPAEEDDDERKIDAEEDNDDRLGHSNSGKYTDKETGDLSDEASDSEGND